MKLGVFDSGIGGLSVLKSIYEAKIFEEIVYYGDTARLPYGTKDKDSIISFSLQALDFFIKQQVDLLVIACNTASAYALDSMQQKASFPVIGVIESGILAVQKKLPDRNSSILILATKATVASKQYTIQLHQLGYHNTYAIATSLFVPLVEEGISDAKILNPIMEHYLKDISFTPHAVILGCTHFPLIADFISGYFHHKSLLIHSGEAILDYIMKHFDIQHCAHTNLEFYASSNTADLKNTAKLWLHL